MVSLSTGIYISIDELYTEFSAQLTESYPVQVAICTRLPLIKIPFGPGWDESVSFWAHRSHQIHSGILFITKAGWLFQLINATPDSQMIPNRCEK